MKNTIISISYFADAILENEGMTFFYASDFHMSKLDGAVYMNVTYCISDADDNYTASRKEEEVRNLRKMLTNCNVYVNMFNEKGEAFSECNLRIGG